MKTVAADDHQRVRIPDAKPGQVFTYETSAGAITLTPMKKAEPRRVQAKLVRKGGRLVFEIPEHLEIAEDAIPRTVPE